MVAHLKGGAFDRQIRIIDYSFPKYLQTHQPALRYFLSTVVAIGDSNDLKSIIDEFYQAGKPSSFILSAIILEFPPKFISKAFRIIFKLIEDSDEIVPKSELIYNFVQTVSNGPVPDDLMEIMNEVWVRIKVFKDVDDFVYVAHRSLNTSLLSARLRMLILFFKMLFVFLIKILRLVRKMGLI